MKYGHLWSQIKFNLSTATKKSVFCLYTLSQSDANVNLLCQKTHIPFYKIVLILLTGYNQSTGDLSLIPYHTSRAQCDFIGCDRCEDRV